ncbi:hypothetical protein SPRG_10676 [Saprolegnia parasitica CBS 223.65]|uniref:FAM86 N-terminal domain-containing protein n=1 Tax=Saprolegnia parasitica (strain CBS 223.65) TaxID=695850 RepID=A0A067BZK4_SAPPC|nr:hypothetical protein SPRG_10676 [Saprolegnia parasitica CBS 223.65]KDO23979.1 hypothetical protein SPRG_10676 [Saprolegnia parasitica CBS 223.65]|eukprot:XP_012205300.1 hypothetical protein SPRG_10676 [Saprolegnia parasitica CBS 223.65]
MPVAVSSLHALVAEMRDALASHALDRLRVWSTSGLGRCFLGIAGFLEYAMHELSAFTKGRAQDDERTIARMHEILMLVADVIMDEDNCVHAAQLGMHFVLMKLLMHEHELIQDGASAVVVNCSSKKANTSGVNTSFPFKTLPLEPPTRAWPLLQALPADARDEEDQVVLIRAVKTRMTGQPKTGYLLWGAAVILARWVHLNRELFHERSVLEVGSGLGLSGIVAAAYSQQMTMTDYQQDTLDALQYNVDLNFDATATSHVSMEHLDWDHLDLSAPKVDIVMASDIICEPSTAEGFANVVRHRLKPNGVAYLVNATSHSRFGVLHLQKLLLAPPFVTTIVPTVWDANEHYTIRLATPDA